MSTAPWAGCRGRDATQRPRAYNTPYRYNHASPVLQSPVAEHDGHPISTMHAQYYDPYAASYNSAASPYTMDQQFPHQGPVLPTDSFFQGSPYPWVEQHWITHPMLLTSTMPQPIPQDYGTQQVPWQNTSPEPLPQESGSHQNITSQVNEVDEATENETEEEHTESATQAGDGEDEHHAMAVYCKECTTWLNGPRQWEDHKIGKKHRKNVQKARRGMAAGTSTANEQVQEPKPDPEPAKKTEAWLWLETGKMDKQNKTEEKTSRSARRRRHKKEKEEREAMEAQQREREQQEAMEDQQREQGEREAMDEQQAGCKGHGIQTTSDEETCPEAVQHLSVKKPFVVPPRVDLVLA